MNVTLLIPAGTETSIIAQARPVPADRPVQFGVRDEAPAALPGYPFYLSAERVAEQALDGVSRRAPIVVTHPGLKPLAQEYFERYLAAYDTAAALARPAESHQPHP